MIYQKYLEPKQTNHLDSQFNSPESHQSIHFLYHFKLEKPKTTECIDQNHSIIGIPIQKIKRQSYKQIKNVYTSNSPKNLITGDDFVHSLNFRYNLPQKNTEKNRSKNKSISIRNKKSPLRKIIKNQSHQMLYDPIQRVFKVIKQQEKTRQQQKLNEKTLKHLHFIPTYTELNDNFLNLSKHIREVKSEKYLNQFDAQKKKSYNHEFVLSCQYLHINEKKFQRKQKSNKNHLKKTKSVQESIYAVSRKNLGQKISASKVKGYFSRKQQCLKRHEKIRYFLNDMNERQLKLRKDHSFNSKQSQFSDSQSPNLQKSKNISKRTNQNKKIQVQHYEYSHSDLSSKSKNFQNERNSDFEFQMQGDFSQKSFENQQFNNNHRKYDEEVSLDLKNMKMYIVDLKEKHQSSAIKQHYNQSQSMESYQHSNFSIEEQINTQQRIVSNTNRFSNKKSENSDQRSSQPSYSNHQPIASINTPAYRNGINQQNPKNKINKNLKMDNLEQKEKSFFESSQISKNELIQIDSIVNKKSLKKSNHTAEIDKKNYLKTPKIQSSSIIEDLSILIDDIQHYSMQNRTDQNITTMKTQLQVQKRQSMVDNNRIKTTPKLSTVKNHEFSKFQFLEIFERDSKQEIKNNTESIKDSYDSDLELKSKKSIVQESYEEISNQIPLNSSLSKKSLKKSLKMENIEEKQGRKKVIKFLKVTHKKNDHSQSLHIKESIKQQKSLINSESQSSQISHKMHQSLKSEKQKNKVVNRNLMQQQNLSDKNQSAEQNKSVQRSSYSQSSYQSSLEKSQENMSNRRKAQQGSRKNNQESQSSYSQNSYSRTLTNNLSKSSIPNNFSKVSSPKNVSKSSFPNQNIKLQLSSSNSKSLVESSYNNNSSQKSLTNSVSNQILKHSTKKSQNLNKKDEQMMFKKKKNFNEYTLNDVARLIEEHEFRIQSYCLYADNSKLIYEEDYQLQKIELLSFLMLKKSIFELNRAISALNGQEVNVFFLTDIEIADQVFEQFRQRQQIRQQKKIMIKSKKQTFQELKQMHVSLQKKYSGEKGFNLNIQRDDMSTQIVKKLSEELNQLYEKWEQNKSNGHELPKITKRLEKRMMEIIELIFLTSQFDGERVKGCELFTEAQSEIYFKSYYQKWFQKIIETIEYFHNRKSTNQDQ